MLLYQGYPISTIDSIVKMFLNGLANFVMWIAYKAFHMDMGVGPYRPVISLLPRLS